MQVFSREGLLHANSRTETGEWTQPATAARTFRAEQHRRLDDRETARWLSDYAAACRKATARPGYLGAETAPTYLRLQDDAQRMIQARLFTPGSPVAIWHHEQTERSARLRQILPAGILPKRSVVMRDLPREEPPAAGRRPPGIGR